MLLHELFLIETPLGNVDWIGDFNTSGTFANDKDRKLVQNPAKLQRLIEKSPYTIDIYYVNLDPEILKKLLKKASWRQNKQYDSYKNKIIRNNNLEQIAIYFRDEFGGETTREELKQMFNIEIPESKNITFVMASAGTSRDEHRLSAWMIMHRFAHAIEDGSFASRGRSNPALLAAYTAYDRLVNADYQNLEYMVSQGTMASARNNNFLIKEEIFTEFLTQYFVKGKITLKSDKELEAKLNDLVKKIFDACVGKIFLGI